MGKEKDNENMLQSQSDEDKIQELYNDMKNELCQEIKSSYDPSPCFNLTYTHTHLNSNNSLYFKPLSMRTKDLVDYDERKFVSVAIDKWKRVNLSRANEMMEEVENEVNRLWKLKREDLLLYPVWYNKCGHVRLTIEDNKAGINFERVTVLRESCCQPKIKVLRAVKTPPSKQHLPSKLLKGKPLNPVVSTDKIAQELAELIDVDVVISRSGLKTIADNYTSSKGSDWMLPFCIKEIVRSDGKRKLVLFVDKALPRPNMTKIELKNWHGKKAVNSFTSLNKLKFRELLMDNTDTYEKTITKVGNEMEMELENSKIENSQELEEIVHKNNKNYTSNIVKSHYSYELWKLEELTEMKILMKNAKRNLKVLVRNKKPAIMDSDPGNFCVSSKLEYQSEFGGELMTLSQLTREWVSLLLNPQGTLIRVRSDANILRYERCERSDITNTDMNIKQLYQKQVKSQLYIVHNVLNYLTSLPKGQYLLYHNQNEGGFASVLKAVKSNCKASFNLYQHFQKLTVREDLVEWPQIDQELMTHKLRLESSKKCLKMKKREKKAKERKVQQKKSNMWIFNVFKTFPI